MSARPFARSRRVRSPEEQAFRRARRHVFLQELLVGGGTALIVWALAVAFHP